MICDVARLLALVILLAASLQTHAAPSPRPVGRHCDLPAPPETAGEELSHGVTLRIFPRAKDITAGYSGCQAVFAPKDDRTWTLVSMTEVVDGDPVRVWWPDQQDTARGACRYRHGRVVRGAVETCAAPEFLLLKSLAPGCIRQIQAAVAQAGVGAGLPRGCEHE